MACDESRWTGRRMRVSRASLAAAGAGAAMLGVAAAFTPGAWPLPLTGTVALIAALPARWPAAGTLAAAAAITTSGTGIAAGTLPLPAAAAEGALVLAYLLALDGAESGLTSRILPWLSGRVQVLALGLAAATLTAIAAATTVPASPWLALAGVAAAGATLLVAAV